MTGLAWVALGAGLSGGFGLWLIASRVAWPSGSRLERRVAPWVSGISVEAHRAVAQRLQRPGLSRLVASRLPGSAKNVLGGSNAWVATALARAGMDVTVEQWRVRVVEFGLLGSLVGACVGGASIALGQGSLAGLFALAVVGAAGGVIIRRQMLVRAAKVRTALVLEELPVVCELLAICLTAGEGLSEALGRVATRGAGPLSHELRNVQRSSALGVPVTDALAALTAKLDIAPLSRSLDHLIAGLERGTPLADILRTQAAETRSEAGRRLQERASAREVIMLFPLVFLILPITIAFAIFPGLLVIQTGL